MLALWLKHRHGSPALARNHLAQTVAGSVWAGILLIGANVAIILLGGYDAPYTWVVVILYFVTCHATLIFLRCDRPRPRLVRPDLPLSAHRKADR